MIIYNETIEKETEYYVMQFTGDVSNRQSNWSFGVNQKHSVFKTTSIEKK